MSDIDKLIKLAKTGPLNYSDVRVIIQRSDCNVSVDTILELACMSRGWDYGNLTYLYGVMLRYASESAEELPEGRRRPRILKSYDRVRQHVVDDRRFSKWGKK